MTQRPIKVFRYCRPTEVSQFLLADILHHTSDFDRPISSSARDRDMADSSEDDAVHVMRSNFNVCVQYLQKNGEPDAGRVMTSVNSTDNVCRRCATELDIHIGISISVAVFSHRFVIQLLELTSIG